MKIEARHYCRKCRVKLPEPIENEHHAFCTKACFEQFYHKRCLACEEPLRTARRSFCPKPSKCADLVRTWPQKYRLARLLQRTPKKCPFYGPQIRPQRPLPFRPLSPRVVVGRSGRWRPIPLRQR